MKKKKATKQRPAKRNRPTLLEFLGGYYQEAQKIFGDDVCIAPELPIAPLPHWGKNIVGQFGKTIFKPVLKLRPSKNTTCEDYGKIIGIIKRGITFYRTEAKEILEAEGLQNISSKDWEKIQPSDQLRTHTIQKLGRAVTDAENLDDLIDELTEKRIAHFEALVAQSSRVMARRGVKDNAMFNKGLAQGYVMLLDQQSAFCGDRGRTSIYLELLASMYEIEKMRRMIPAKKDADLYDHLKPWYRFPGTRADGIAWLRNVCDDISLYMSDQRGAPRKHS